MSSTTNLTADPHTQLVEVQHEMVDLEEQLSEFAAAGKVAEMEPVASQLWLKKRSFDLLKTIVSKLDDAATAKNRAEQERVRQEEQERQQQARAKLEADYAALDRELTDVYTDAENSICQLQQSIFRAAAVAARLAPLAQQLGHPTAALSAQEAVRPIIYRGRHLLRQEANLFVLGLGNRLFTSDGTTLGSDPLVQVVEAPK